MAGLADNIRLEELKPELGLGVRVTGLDLASNAVEQNADALRCKIIAGSANNQLATPAAGEALRKADITYVPDYVANAGALIKGVTEYVEAREVGFDVVDRIGQNVLMVLERADKEGRTTNEVADLIARERLA